MLSVVGTRASISEGESLLLPILVRWLVMEGVMFINCEVEERRERVRDENCYVSRLNETKF